MANKLLLQGVQPVPNNIAAAGGSLTLKIRLVTTDGPATATVTCAVAAGLPYKITQGASSAHSVGKTSKTISKPIVIKKSGSGSADLIKIEVLASIPGDTKQKGSCVVVIKNALALAVAEFRESNELSQSALAERLGVSRSPISRIERGNAASQEVLVKIAELLDE